MGITMRKLPVILIFLMSIVHLRISAQSLPLTTEAARLCQDLKFDQAEEKINEAMETSEATYPYTWYVEGFIAKEIYKNRDVGNRQSVFREKALESFSKCLAMDKKNEFSEMCKAGIKYLATTFYNDALMRTREIDMQTAPEAEKLFSQFRRYMRTVDPVFPMSNYEKEFSMSMAQRYFSLWQLDMDNEELSERALNHYVHAQRMDSLESDIYYNIAVIYYNRAVFKYRKINAETDFIDLMDIQQEGSNLIKNKALVNMNKAYALDSERSDIIRGLFFIHRALEHEKDVEYFKGEINRLVSEGKITDPWK